VQIAEIERGGGRLKFAVSGRNHAPTLLLLHPLGANREVWTPQLPTFEQFFHVVRPDLRGHGESSLPEGEPSVRTLGDYVDDMLAILDQLHIDRAHWCGLSLGGAIALQAAIRHPKRVHRLVLANTAPEFAPSSLWDERMSAARSDGLASVLAAVPQRWFSAGFRDRAPEQVERIRSMLETAGLRGYLEACGALRAVNLRGELAAVQAPTLVIGGAGDISTPIELAEALRDGIAGADLAVLDAAHLSNVEQSEDFTEVVTAFLRD
jgi:3-oxoadipate enol-lactonase